MLTLNKVNRPGLKPPGVLPAPSPMTDETVLAEDVVP